MSTRVGPPELVVGVETGGCPHTAIREDASANLEAVHDLIKKFPSLELLLIDSGGDNLAATFSPELVDAAIYVIDVKRVLRAFAPSGEELWSLSRRELGGEVRALALLPRLVFAIVGARQVVCLGEPPTK